MGPKGFHLLLFSFQGSILEVATVAAVATSFLISRDPEKTKNAEAVHPLPLWFHNKADNFDCQELAIKKRKKRH